MSLFFPDTSTLISLLDEEEPFHDKAREIMREYRIADIFVPMSVQAEWQSRVMREHRKMVTGIIRLIDKKRSENIMEMTSAEFNVIADTAAREIKGQRGIESRKLDQVRSYMQKEMANFYRSSSGKSVSKRKSVEIKEHILRLDYVFYSKGTAVIGFFIKHGYSHPDIPEEVEKTVKNHISEHRIDLETQDAMILGDLMCYAAADSQEYDFVVGDKNFFKKGKEYVKAFDGVNSKVNFRYLGDGTD